MCPDRQIISLYLDGELPSPWKEKMEAHLESCAKCRSILDGYRRLSENLEDVSEEKIEAAKERVWKKFTAPELVVTKNTPERKAARTSFAGRPWSRSITLPLPAAAAALVIIVSFFVLTAIRERPMSQPLPQDVFAAANIANDQGMVPLQDMGEVLKYLSSQDDGDIMIIRLPESRNFSRAGEPALINAVDYSQINTETADYPRSRNPR